MSPIDVPEDPDANAGPLNEYVGVIWIGDEPGKRLNVWARSGAEARDQVVAEYGEGHVITLQNEDDASRPR
jgi:hypothetical protein